MRKIEIMAYTPQWHEHFEREVALISPILVGNLIAIDHIGSTSVPNLAAKPVIDILLEVKSLDVLDKCNAALQHISYKAKGEMALVVGATFKKVGISAVIIFMPSQKGMSTSLSIAFFATTLLQCQISLLNTLKSNKMQQ